MKTAAVLPLERVESCIVIVRGQKVMLDADLAELYGVPTKRFNEQVRRNAERFPADFMFQLTNQEVAILRSQIATSSSQTRHAIRASQETADRIHLERLVGGIFRIRCIRRP